MHRDLKLSDSNSTGINSANNSRATEPTGRDKETSPQWQRLELKPICYYMITIDRNISPSFIDMSVT